MNAMTSLFRTIQHYLVVPSPYTDLNLADPLIYSAVRRVQWAGTPFHLKAYARRIRLYVLVGCAAFVLFLLGAVGTGGFWITYGFIMIPLTAMSIVAVVFTDFFCLLYGITIMRDIRHGQLSDLIYLSQLSRNHLIESRFLLAQLYAWRAVIVLVYSRAALAVLGIPYIVYLLSLVPTEPSLDLRQKALILGMAIGTLPGILYFFVYEPLWRFRQVVVMALRHAAEWTSPFTIWAWTIFDYLRYLIWWLITWSGIAFVGFGSAMIAALISFIYDTTNLPLLGVFIFAVNLLGGVFVVAFIGVVSVRQQQGNITYLLRQSAYYIHKHIR